MDVVDDDGGPLAKLTALRHHLRSAGVAVAANKDEAADGMPVLVR